MKKSLLIFALIFLSSCSEKVAGGGVETTNGGLAGIVYKLDGSPAVSARVTIRSSSYLAGMINENSENNKLSAIADESGKWTIDLKEADDYSVEILSGNNASLSRLWFAGGDTLLELGADTLSASETLYGCLDCKSECKEQMIRVYGLNYAVRTDSNGCFRFENIPAGKHLVHVGDSELNSWQFVMSTGTNFDSPLNISIEKSLLLEDFEVEDNHYALAEFMSGGLWYSYRDVRGDRNSHLFPLQGELSFDQVYRQEDENGFFLSCSLAVDTSNGISWVGLGFDFREGKYSQDSRLSWVDLTELDSISFRAKGSGILDLQITTEAFYLLDSLSGDHFKSSIELQNDWTDIVIKVEDLTTSLKNGAPMWNEAASRVAAMTFQAESPVRLELDDIRLYGVGMESFLYKREN